MTTFLRVVPADRLLPGPLTGDPSQLLSRNGWATAASLGLTGGGGGALVSVSSPTTTGTQTLFGIPTGAGDLLLFLNNASLLTLQGIQAGTHGQRLTLVSIGAGQVDLAHEHASASAANRLTLRATSGLTSLAAGKGTAVFQYDTNAGGGTGRWRLALHDQGDWITVPYTSTDYTADTGTWTVDSGDLLAYRYLLVGRTLFVQIVISNSTTSGVTVGLFVLLPVGFTISTVANTTAAVTANAVSGSGVAQVNNGVSTTQLRILKIDFSVWANGTNNNGASFTLPIPVD